MRKRWERDAGLRLDHILLSASIADRLRDAGVDRTVRGKVNASDHAPVWVELRDISTARFVSGIGSRVAPARKGIQDAVRAALEDGFDLEHIDEIRYGIR